MLKLEIKKRTPSINHLFFHRGNMKILTNEARKIRKYILACIEEQNIISDGYNVPLKVLVEIHENWLTKKGIIKRIDVSNREKFLTDSVFKALNLDDKFIVDLRYVKVQNTAEEKAIVTIEKTTW